MDVVHMRDRLDLPLSDLELLTELIYFPGLESRIKLTVGVIRLIPIFFHWQVDSDVRGSKDKAKIGI